MSRYLLGPRCLLWMANQEPATLQWFSTIRPLDCIVSDLSMAIAKAAVAEAFHDLRDRNEWFSLLDALYANLRAEGASMLTSVDNKVLERFIEWRNVAPLDSQGPRGTAPLAQDLRLLIATADLLKVCYTEPANLYLTQAAARGVAVHAL
ncbi:hypothetical protein [Delftia acidovorans]|uniref:hypothetical protein n=1 Tax=Delftia acidovorans TaxID=80866 RepID=UPI003342A010